MGRLMQRLYEALVQGKNVEKESIPAYTPDRWHVGRHTRHPSPPSLRAACPSATKLILDRRVLCRNGTGHGFPARLLNYQQHESIG